MPKMKTDSGAKKRVKVTGSGRLRRRKAFRGHMLEHKSSERKRRLGRETDFAPGDEKQIKEFCTSTYHVTFDMFSKISVKGDDQHPLYKYLTDPSTDPKFAGDIDWNFAKFIVGRHGEILARFPAHQDPTSPEVVAAIQSALAQK